jgi:hypothetical protein
MNSTDIEKYAANMNEIKLRMKVIDIFISGDIKALYLETTVETIGLQFRKIFELIAFSSLAANRHQYALVYTDFITHWQAAKLIKNLRKINADFYPKPVIEDKSKDLLDLKESDQDYLTEDQLIEAHGRCGELLHTKNPFGGRINYELFQKQFPIWRNKIVFLLNNHKVHLINDRGFYLFHMKEDGHDEVRWYRFDLVSR